MKGRWDEGGGGRRLLGENTEAVQFKLCVEWISAELSLPYTYSIQTGAEPSRK
jgi:hypothetical protein